MSRLSDFKRGMRWGNAAVGQAISNTSPSNLDRLSAGVGRIVTCIGLGVLERTEVGRDCMQSLAKLVLLRKR